MFNFGEYTGICHLPLTSLKELKFFPYLRGKELIFLAWLHMSHTELWGGPKYRCSFRNRIENRRPAIIQTAVFMYEAAIHRYLFYLGWFWGSKCNVDCKWKFCSVRILFTNVMLPYMSHIVGVLRLTVKPIVAHGVKADRLSSVHWKDILDVHCTDHVTLAVYRCCLLYAWSPHLFLKHRQWVFPLVIGFACSVILVYCCCLWTCLWSLSWRGYVNPIGTLIV